MQTYPGVVDGHAEILGHFLGRAGRRQQLTAAREAFTIGLRCSSTARKYFVRFGIDEFYVSRQSRCS